jgi:sugar lactone lactonase YvrE
MRTTRFAITITTLLAALASAPAAAHPGAGIVVDAAGQVYFVHGPTSRIFRIDATGKLTVHCTAKGGQGPAVPHHLVLDRDGSLYTTSDKGGEFWRIAPDGAATRVPLPVEHRDVAALGFGGNPFTRSGDGAIYGVVAQPPTVSAVFRVDSAGACKRLAGGERGSQDGKGDATRFDDLHGAGMALDRDGNLLITDGGRRIRRLSPDGTVTTLAGGEDRAFVDGPADRARFVYAMGLAAGADGAVYIADAQARRIRKLSTTGDVTTLAGDGDSGGDDGPAAEASFDTPAGVAVDGAGNLFVLDWFGSKDGVRVRRISRDGMVTTLASVE